jgi:hypothetical protein
MKRKRTAFSMPFTSLLDQPLHSELAEVQDHFNALCCDMQDEVLSFISGFRESKKSPFTVGYQKLLQLLLGVIPSTDMSVAGMDAQIWRNAMSRLHWLFIVFVVGNARRNCSTNSETR